MTRYESVDRLRERVQRSVDSEGLRPLASRTGVAIGRFRSVISGRSPSLHSADEICSALGISLTIGALRGELERVPDRRLAELLARLVDHWEALGPVERRNLESALSGLLDLAAALSRDRGPARSRSLETREEPGVYTTMPDRPDGPRLALAPVSVTATDDGGDPPGGRPVPMHELEVAAGGGAVDIDDAPLHGRVWFRREWLDRRGLEPTRCVVIDVRGGSMEPTLADGCSILVARDRTSRREGRVYVVRTEDGLVAKRAGREDGEWRLVSDAGPPDWPPAPWRGAEVKGEVIWTARTLAPTPG